MWCLEMQIETDDMNPSPIRACIVITQNSPSTALVKTSAGNVMLHCVKHAYRIYRCTYCVCQFQTIFFCGEGPRSRCYERTADLRLIVQPCDEDD